MSKTKPGFTLTFDPRESAGYRHGYWYAVTNDDNYDASGPTPIDALSALAILLHKELLERGDVK